MKLLIYIASIVAFGDSLTVAGEETFAGLARLPQVLTDASPNLMILLESGNDILRNKRLRQTKRNLAAMIELAKAQGVEALLIRVPEKRLFSDVAPLYKELVIEYELVFADGLLCKNKYRSDTVYLN